MAENVDQEHLENPETSYERRDLSTHGVLMFLISLAIAAVLIHIVLWGMYAYLDKFQQRRQPSPNPLAAVHSEVNPPTPRTVQEFPQPRLQPDPVADLNKFRAQEEEILNSYGWVDKSQNIAHIPIERAMDVLVARGLPVMQASNRAKAAAAPGGPASQAQRSPQTTR